MRRPRLCGSGHFRSWHTDPISQLHLMLNHLQCPLIVMNRRRISMKYLKNHCNSVQSRVIGAAGHWWWSLTKHQYTQKSGTRLNTLCHFFNCHIHQSDLVMSLMFAETVSSPSRPRMSSHFRSARFRSS